MRFGSLFCGIGGFDLGLERAGMQCAWQVEIDPYAQKVLAKHWPDVRRHADVCTFPPEEGDWKVDLICGGFPCQDISYAGKGAGLAGARSGLWYQFARIIGHLRPPYVIVENVSALLNRGMGEVLGTLASLGYDAEWHVIPASAVGAPHRRDRVWIVAYSDGRRRHRSGSDSGDGGTLSQQGPQRIVRGSGGGDDVPDPKSKRRRGRRPRGVAGACSGKEDAAVVADAAGFRLQARGGCERPARFGRAESQLRSQGGDVADAAGGGPQVNRSAWDEVARESLGSWLAFDSGGDGNDRWWATEPNVGRVAHGISSRVDRLRCLGNAVVPQVVELIGRAILQHEQAND